MHNSRLNSKSGHRALLELKHMNFSTSENRLLFHDLNMVLEREKVAVTGRNGVGKSTLLNIMSGKLVPDSGEVRLGSSPLLVPQQLNSNSNEILQILYNLRPAKILDSEIADAGLPSCFELKHSKHLSCGELRKLHLLVAKLSSPDILLMDEPTEDLDETGIRWLSKWISSWQNGLVVVSHDRNLLSLFQNFFIISESGCDCFSGTFNKLSKKLGHDADDAEMRHIRKINSLNRKEEQSVKVQKRRRRKKNFGRISELERCTPKQRLNKKRSKAQVNQGRVAKISQNRIKGIRKQGFESRRTLTVNFPLALPVPQISASKNQTSVQLKDVSAKFGNRCLFRHVNLSLAHESFAVTGPNGSGKTTFLNIILGNIKPDSGSVSIPYDKTGSISQGGSNWMTEDSLLSYLMIHAELQTKDEVVRLLRAHKFPIALASRPLSSLSPGERVRAALICLFQQKPEIEILVLDEPTYSLDFIGETALRAALKAWPGTLLVSSHNIEFLNSIGISKRLTLDGN